MNLHALGAVFAMTLGCLTITLVRVPDPRARSAAPTAADPNRQIRAYQLVATVADTKPSDEHVWAVAAHAVFAMRDRFKMGRVDAGASTTQVIEFKAWRDCPDEQFVTNPMGRD